MSFEGDVVGWVAILPPSSRTFADRPGDPHSPHRYGTSLPGQLRGLAHAHVAGCYATTPARRRAMRRTWFADLALRGDLSSVPGLVRLSLGLPFAAGWAIGGSSARRTGRPAVGLTGPRHLAAARHLSVNSLCHVIGTRPFTTRRYDRATNLWPLALASSAMQLGTTCIIPIPPAPGTAPIPGRSISPPASFASSSASAGRLACTGPAPARPDFRRRDRGSAPSRPGPSRQRAHGPRGVSPRVHWESAGATSRHPAVSRPEAGLLLAARPWSGCVTPSTSPPHRRCGNA